METIASKKTRINMENVDHFAQLLETAEVEYQKYLYKNFLLANMTISIK